MFVSISLLFENLLNQILWMEEKEKLDENEDFLEE